MGMAVIVYFIYLFMLLIRNKNFIEVENSNALLYIHSIQYQTFFLSITQIPFFNKSENIELLNSFVSEIQVATQNLTVSHKFFGIVESLKIIYFIFQLVKTSFLLILTQSLTSICQLSEF
ncbi:hypothetical protein PanWU01x14_075360 [Parasponia andersonii]|uniref:Uncharacterized protein n=1 Tax=Parasponia andersonii TaxID=3476 RepID=A0A2P5DCU6_PARAD|nr:hypothetical protein PanWU01x14_075360 [Parasponia andersonii]